MNPIRPLDIDFSQSLYYHIKPTAMNVLKHQSFFRPATRPTSPVTQPPSVPFRPDSSHGLERASRSINRLSLGNFRRPSSASGDSINPALTTLIQDGSYLEMWSLKLGEAVSKALSQPAGPAAAHEQVYGKRPIPQGRGRALGALITSYVLLCHPYHRVKFHHVSGSSRPPEILLICTRQFFALCNDLYLFYSQTYLRIFFLSSPPLHFNLLLPQRPKVLT